MSSSTKTVYISPSSLQFKGFRSEDDYRLNLTSVLSKSFLST